MRKPNSGEIMTVTGHYVAPLALQAHDIEIRDIAHALSNLCRFGGHCSSFYSVAQHSWGVSKLLPTRLALWGLLHDASEAYLVDLPRPLKYAPGMEYYREAERRVMLAVCERFGLGSVQSDLVTGADEIMLATERRDLMQPGSDWGLVQPLTSVITPWTPGAAEKIFLSRFYELRV